MNLTPVQVEAIAGMFWHRPAPGIDLLVKWIRENRPSLATALDGALPNLSPLEIIASFGKSLPEKYIKVIKGLVGKDSEGFHAGVASEASGGICPPEAGVSAPLKDGNALRAGNAKVTLSP